MNYKKFGIVIVTSILAATGVLFFSSKSTAFNKAAIENPLYEKKVFLLGDIHAKNSLNKTLMYELVANGATYFASASKDSWGVGEWYDQRHRIEYFIEKHKPDLFLIVLGTNDHDDISRVSFHNETYSLWWTVNNAMRKVNSDNKWKVVWILPPRIVGKSSNLQIKIDKVSEVIKSVVSSENYVESKDITGSFGREEDGIGFTYAGAQDWARSLIPRIKKVL